MSDRGGSGLSRCFVSSRPADAEAQGPANLAVAVTWAARGDGEIRRTFVRPAKTFGVRLKARIASCNSPDAALIVLD